MTSKYGVIRAVWMVDDEEQEELQAFLSNLKTYIANSKEIDRSVLSDYSNKKLVSLIYTSNKLEKTIPLGVSESETHKVLHEIVEGKLVCDSQPWISESGSRFQLFQHVQAFLYLQDKALSGEPLTRDSVLEAHKILMCNSTSETGAPILCGEFRTCSVSAGDHIYPSHEIISSQVDEI